ncbi:MAG: hypothetical protein RMK75_03900 [Aquificaceae bacterium]|nr:hypothetical protein [Aquificaceae bacterium]MDW8423450.1 hypothetical protein [Aquificaceae bacterium]
MLIKWIAGVILAFLIIDHIWVHYGGPFLEKYRSQYREELKKGTVEKQEVPMEQSYRKSILDETWERVKGLLRRDDEEKTNR